MFTFDKHRSGGQCIDPAELGLTEIGLTEIGGMWSTPEGHASRAAFGDRARRRTAVPLSDAYGDATEPRVRVPGTGSTETPLFEMQDGAA